LAQEDVLLSPKARTSAVLLALATILVAGNIWVAAARSTIPLAIDDVVIGKQLRLEKHPTKDDVHLVQLKSRGIIQVDRDVYKQIDSGDHLRKERWSRVLECNERQVNLDWSADARGMARAMPLACGLMLTLALWICCRS
jgi:hypothetical protein